MLYEAYLQSRSGGSFLCYCRCHYVDKDGVHLRTHGRGHASGKGTMAVGVKFHYELLDLYHGEFATMFFPHATREALFFFFISTTIIIILP